MKKIFSTFSFVAFSICVLPLAFAVGCGSDFSLAPVSGVVVANGEPIEGIEVVFYPKPTEENPAPGPFAAGTTDSAGKFTLVTREGQPGAVIGDNQIGFELPGASNSALTAAKSSLSEMNPKVDQEGIKIVKARIATIEKTLKQFSMVAPEFLNSRSLEIVVPTEGLVDYKIDISKK